MVGSHAGIYLCVVGLKIAEIVVKHLYCCGLSVKYWDAQLAVYILNICGVKAAGKCAAVAKTCNELAAKHAIDAAVAHLALGLYVFLVILLIAGLQQHMPIGLLTAAIEGVDACIKNIVLIHGECGGIG